jgi:hypothetical protein
MTFFSKPATAVIQQRYSCRTYLDKPIDTATREQLQNYIDTLPPGPFGSKPRFKLVAATEAERQSLRGLGTYGFIQGATGFIIGAIAPASHNLEDFGYQMERIILYATDLGLGTCWLGGTFTKSAFARQIALKKKETIPAVTATGQIADPEQARRGLVSRVAGADRRKPWETLFFNQSFGVPITQASAGRYAAPLSMVRVAPSASNKQPWRVVKDGDTCHFYLQRTPGYRRGFFQVLLNLCDLQRVDMGIALCHFELTARELGLPGAWKIQEPGIEKLDKLTEYTASWV